MNKSLKQNTWLALGMMCALLITQSTEAASFDCGKAQTKVEHLICDNAEISKLDEELSVAYKAALKNTSKVEAIKQAQKQWMKERNGCADAACVKRAYETRLASLRPATSAPVTSAADANNTGQTRDAAPAAVPIGCSNDESDNSNIHAQDIAGLYSQSVEGLSAIIGRPEEKRSGYNYLAITPLSGNRIRVRLSTKEINGHDCGFDSEALLCGRTIWLMPSEVERSTLDLRKLPIPRLQVTTNQIAFIPDAEGTFVWGSPYCGAMGYLRQNFSRDTKKLRFDDAIFNQ